MPSSDEFGPFDVRIGTHFARIAAHHEVALELYRLHRYSDALLQASRPITRIFPELQGELVAYGSLVSDLGSALAAVASCIRDRAGDRLTDEIERAVAVLDGGIDAIVGDSATSRPFRGTVAAQLLNEASQRYREAVEGELASYHEAYALVRRANRIAERVLLDLLASPTPPSQLPAVDSFEGAVEEARNVLVGELGAWPEMRKSPQDDLLRIGRMLRSILGACEAGTTPLASRLATETFVRLYTPLRGALTERAPELEADLSELLGVELRLELNENAGIDKISEAISRAEVLLARAGRALI
jgi:hypothetical protein